VYRVAIVDGTIIKKMENFTHENEKLRNFIRTKRRMKSQKTVHTFPFLNQHHIKGGDVTADVLKLGALTFMYSLGFKVFISFYLGWPWVDVD
jgi:hypothetical protein